MLSSFRGNAADLEPLSEPRRARILARLGVADSALPLIERLLAGPSLFSVYEPRLNPDFDPIRNHPRYQALSDKYGS